MFGGDEQGHDVDTPTTVSVLVETVPVGDETVPQRCNATSGPVRL